VIVVFIHAVLVISAYILLCPIDSLVRFYKMSAIFLVLLDRARTSAEKYITITMTTHHTTPATTGVGEGSEHDNQGNDVSR